MNSLSNALDKGDVTLKLLKDGEEVKLKEVTIGKDAVYKSDVKKEEVVKKENKFVKFLCSVSRVFEGLFDSVAKKFLKKKFKLNYSVYNDSKKAIKAIANKDSKSFWKKSTDAILNVFKKIPTDTKNVIKDTKNIAIDEIFMWKE